MSSTIWTSSGIMDSWICLHPLNGLHPGDYSAKAVDNQIGWIKRSSFGERRRLWYDRKVY
jgi:hypothetical protein